MKEAKIGPTGLQVLHDYMDSLEAENERLRKDQERLNFVIGRRDFLWDLWNLSSDEVKHAIDEAMKNE